ncbi:MAG: sigma factor-like helix-turn-helix DNA-binding protein, partial [Polyangiaceae bacterium]
IAVNLSLNTIRSRKSSRIVPHDPKNDARMASFLVEKRPSALADPAGDASRKEMYGILCEAIDSLSDTLRTTLVVVCVEGLSHEEASVVLGAPEGTIAWRIHEARRKIREILEERGFDLEGEVA